MNIDAQDVQDKRFPFARPIRQQTILSILNIHVRSQKQIPNSRAGESDLEQRANLR